MVEHHVGDLQPVSGEHVDHPGRHPGLLEQLHREVRGELLGGRGLPDDRVAHQRRSRGQVAGDRGEVERRDRVDEPLQRAVVGAVPDALAVGDRLVGEDLPRVVHVEAPEVDQLARSVDLRLPDRLRLAQHRRRVEPGTPGTGQQVGGLEDDAGAVVEGHRPPAGSSVTRGADRGLRVPPRRVLQHAEHAGVLVRLDHGDLGTTAHHLPPADRGGQVERGRCEVGELGLDRDALGAARGVVEVGLVDRSGWCADRVHARDAVRQRHREPTRPDSSPHGHSGPASRSTSPSRPGSWCGCPRSSTAASPPPGAAASPACPPPWSGCLAAPPWW